MAEAALYGNFKEPSFPFDSVADRLLWLPDYLSSVAAEVDRKNLVVNRNSTYGALTPLLDTILVFTRARTSALHHNQFFNACHDLVTRLNAVLKDAGEEAWYHRVELVRRGPRQFFITCTNSPRFDWGTRLTHLQVGRNLDYIASGHMFSHPFPPRAQIQFVERETMTNLFSECVLLGSVEDEEFVQHVVRFNDVKERLMNHVFEMLGLRYRMKWVLNSVPKRRKVLEVLRNPTPPTQQWWNENCFLVNTPGVDQDYTDIQFCSYRSNFRQHWPVIQAVYFFSIDDDVVVDPYQLTTQQQDEVLEFWIEVRQFFRNTQMNLIRKMTPEESQKFSARVMLQLEELRRKGDKLDDLYGTKESKEEIIKRVMKQGVRHTWQELLLHLGPSIRYRAWLFWEALKIHVFQRWKLRAPLVYQGPPIPAGTKADAIWL